MTDLVRDDTPIQGDIHDELGRIQDNTETFGQAIETTLGALDVISVSAEYSPTSVDKRIFVANRAYRVLGASIGVDVLGGDGGTVEVMPRKVPSTTAITAGTALLTATLDLKTASNATAAGTVVADPADLTLAAGDALALDFTGALTAAIGVVTVDLLPV